ncbi:acetylornithine deacetylase [Tropicibacter naphthalenivorans]|uniref:Acetylornithine deacetylase n=1 Tax=Tropicibacter naphthalenivorans TaxID=441103 RepID=A0A0P1GQS7_9RHOB|nr:acetylornithine deacetylase [Tropicibacter naphthalenivorans]CUH78084.1 Acetylornithine deacetylase [Tropicibacter naphthalenivorans]SMC93797.1 acetylornithine deacetylase [Tropicibacter naphthalenivorans]
MSTLKQTETLLRDLIAFPTVSADSNLDMMAYMANWLEGFGARVDLHHDRSGRKANLWATLGPSGDGGIVLSGHSDVVPTADQDWTQDPFQMWSGNDLLFGRGTCDMKGFIAACLAMVPQWANATLRRPLHLCFTHDEEVGCLGARALVPELQKRGIAPTMAIIGEPTEMRIIEGHKGCCEYTARFTGLEGHGSAPDRGVNAVNYAVRYAARLLELAEQLKTRTPANSRFDPPWTTVNIGRLSGGVAHNVIPGKAEIDWEMRPVHWDDAHFVKDALDAYVQDTLLPAMRAVSPSAEITTEVIGEVVGLSPMEDNAARDLVRRLTGQNACELVPFGTEAGLFQQMGMSVVVCGPGSIAQAHKPDEFIARSELKACLDMLHGLGRTLAA